MLGLSSIAAPIIPDTESQPCLSSQFNIEMEESDVFREELRTWRSVTSLLQQQYQPVDPESASSSLSGSTSGSRIPLSAYSAIPTMVIEVILDVSDMSSNQVLVLNNALSSKDGSTRRFRVDLSGKGKGTNLHDVAPDVLGGTSPKKCNIVLERWTLSLRPPPPPTSPELPGVYKHCIIVSHDRMKGSTRTLLKQSCMRISWWKALSSPVHARARSPLVRAASQAEAADGQERTQDWVPSECKRFRLADSGQRKLGRPTGGSRQARNQSRWGRHAWLKCAVTAHSQSNRTLTLNSGVPVHSQRRLWGTTSNLFRFKILHSPQLLRRSGKRAHLYRSLSIRPLTHIEPAGPLTCAASTELASTSAWKRWRLSSRPASSTKTFSSRRCASIRAVLA